MDEVSVSKISIGERYREELGDMEELIASIKKYGVIQPITIDQDYRLIAGGRRLLAVTAIGLETIPAIVRESDPLDSLEIELIENIHRKDLTWQERAKLEKKIYESKGGDMGIRGVAALVGSSRSAVHDHIQMADAMELIPELAGCKNEDDAWKKLQKLQEEVAVKELIKRAKTRAADSDTPITDKITWGDESYIIADVLDGLSELRNGTFDFAEIDPPYGIDLKQMKRGKSSAGKDIENYEEFTGGEGYDYEEFIRDVLTNTHSILADDAFCILWFGHTHYSSVYQVFCEAGFRVNEVPGVWYKGAQGQTQQPQIHLANCYEQFLVGRKGDPILQKQGRANVFQFSPVPGGQKIHPTERPLALMDEILDTFTYPDQRILVPFAGSGVTLLASHNTHKECVGFDVSKEFKNKFLLRLEEEGDEKDTSSNDNKT